MSDFPSAPAHDPLTRRERQIMDVVYARGSATAREIEELMPDPPSYATVRTLLRVLERKRHLSHRVRGKTFVYEPRRPAESAAKSALRRLLNVFFNNSIEQALSGLLELERSPLSRQELDRLEWLIKKAKKTNRRHP